MKIFRATSYFLRMEKIYLFAVTLIAMTLLVAAYGKIFFPSEGLWILDYVVSFFEVLLISFLVLFYPLARTWLMVSLLFACWGGYALFWYVVQLPCACMGEAFALPDGLSLMIDVIFYFVSVLLAYLAQASRRELILFGIGGLLFASMGFLVARSIFENFLL